MNEEMIKYHESSNTFIARKKAFFEDEVTIDGNFIVGAGANFWSNLTVKGNLKLGKGSVVKGDVKADNIIIGPRSEIKGNVEAANDLKLFDSVKVSGSATAGRDMHIRPGCEISFAKATTILELIGQVNIKEIESGTKVIVRSE
ncbi:polymer-forming cytoskeletal protein [Methanolobus sp. ZRKC3]|uniref:bactofilin family protein n=1 Tax=Methanolobus sp. ZRKC3 TaxID=3125786 RepID=UPI003248304F